MSDFFDKKWDFKKWAFSLYLDINNVYNAKNAEGTQSNYNFDPMNRAPVVGLPFYPNLGLRGDF